MIASSIAALELILLLGAGTMLLAKPITHALDRAAVASVTATPPAPTKQLRQAIHRANAPAGRAKPHKDVKIMVLNGNGLNGAAGQEAARLHGLGYKISGTANAKRQDYATSVVMYKPGYRSDGMHLAKAIGIKVVGPLDGVEPGMLHGGDIAVIVGA